MRHSKAAHISQHFLPDASYRASHEQLLVYNHKLFKIDNVMQNILITVTILKVFLKFF